MNFIVETKDLDRDVQKIEIEAIKINVATKFFETRLHRIIQLKSSNILKDIK